MIEKTSRKELRLKSFDYSSEGAYFVTICVKDKHCILSDIIMSDQSIDNNNLDDPSNIPKVKLTPIGKTVEKHLLSSEKIAGVFIDQYVIMPDHIHIIILINTDKNLRGLNEAENPQNSRSNELLPHIISTFKRFCNREMGENIFQRSYMEHIIRNVEDYEIKRKYIYENPMRWYQNKLYTKQ